MKNCQEWCHTKYLRLSFKEPVANENWNFPSFDPTWCHWYVQDALRGAWCGVFCPVTHVKEYFLERLWEKMASLSGNRIPDVCEREFLKGGKKPHWLPWEIRTWDACMITHMIWITQIADKQTRCYREEKMDTRRMWSGFSHKHMHLRSFFHVSRLLDLNALQVLISRPNVFTRFFCRFKSILLVKPHWVSCDVLNYIKVRLIIYFC